MNLIKKGFVLMCYCLYEVQCVYMSSQG